MPGPAAVFPGGRTQVDEGGIGLHHTVRGKGSQCSAPVRKDVRTKRSTGQRRMFHAIQTSRFQTEPRGAGSVCLSVCLSVCQGSSQEKDRTTEGILMQRIEEEPRLDRLGGGSCHSSESQKVTKCERKGIAKNRAMSEI